MSNESDTNKIKNAFVKIVPEYSATIEFTLPEAPASIRERRGSTPSAEPVLVG